jgi:tetratricopeptide (TPR) repeat protein
MKVTQRYFGIGMLAALVLSVFCVPLVSADETENFVVLVGGFDGPDPETYPVTETVVRWVRSIIGDENGIEFRIHDSTVPLEEFGAFYREAYEAGADGLVMGLYGIEGSIVSLRLISSAVSVDELGSDREVQIADDAEPARFDVSLLNPQSSPPAGVRFFAHSIAASIYNTLGQYEKALAEIDCSIEFGAGISDTDLARIYLFRATLLRKTFSDYTAALADCNKALELDSDNYQAYSDLAYTLYVMEQYEEAFEVYNTRVEMFPDSADAYYDRAIFLNDCGYIAEAASDVLCAVELEPDNPRYQYDLGLLYLSNGYMQSSMEVFNDLIEMSPEYVEAYIDRALVHMKQDNYQAAHEDLLQALEIDSSVSRIYNGLVLTCTYFEEWDDLLEYANTGKELDPEDQNFPKAIASVYMNMGDFDRALSEFELAYEVVMTYHNGVSSPESDLQRLIELIDVLREISEMDQNSSEYHYARGYQLSESGAYELAVEEFNEALSIDPDFEDAYYMRGMCCVETGDTEQAVSDMETVLELTAFSTRRRMAEQILQQLTE